MAENVNVKIIIDPISSMANNDSTQTSCLCLTIVREFKCVCVEMLGTSSLSCVAHWPRFQLFSARDNGRNGFITEHNTWVLLSTIVFKVLAMAWFGAVHCMRYPLWRLLTQPPMSTEPAKPHSQVSSGCCNRWLFSHFLDYPLGSTNGNKILNAGRSFIFYSVSL